MFKNGFWTKIQMLIFFINKNNTIKFSGNVHESQFFPLNNLILIFIAQSPFNQILAHMHIIWFNFSVAL